MEINLVTLTRSMLALLIALSGLAVATTASAGKRPEYDILASSASKPVPANLKAQSAQFIRPGSALHVHERFGVPTFLWASSQGSAAGLTALRAKLSGGVASASGAAPALTPEAAARAHMGTYASLYRATDADVSNLTVAHVHDVGRGPVIVQFKQVISGVEVFREEARVVMTRDLDLVSIAGYISSTEGSSFAAQRPFSSANAVAAAFSDLSGQVLGAAAFNSLGAAEGGYESVTLAVSGIDGAPTQPARIKPVLFHSTDGLQSAWYIEVDSANANGNAPDYYSYVVSAVDGSILCRHDLTAYDLAHDFTYRVYAAPPNDPKNPGHPYDGPMGTLFSPHPTGSKDGTQFPGTVPQVDMTISSSVYSKDPWLPVGATVTTGNNVDAFVDLTAPDGFTPYSLDSRADLVSAGSFARTYDLLAPNAVNQQKAAVLQMFYNVNFFHDWYYVSGFTEAAGNAQANNYGRGGIQGDRFIGNGQDYASRNNANMGTPADGASPRMRMFLWDGIADRHAYFTPAGGVRSDYATGQPLGWGIPAASAFDISAEMVWVTDGVGSTAYPPATTTTATIHDGCDYTPGTGGTVDPNWANVTGKIAFIDRGGMVGASAACYYVDKAYNATRAGAVAVVIASTTTHNAPAAGDMGNFDPHGTITIPAYQLGTPDGDAIRASFIAGKQVFGHLVRAPTIDRDSTVDTQVMAHEWGHYISNRLIYNSAGLNTNMAAGMGEGYAEFHAMLLTVKEEDTSVPSNASFNGAYGLGLWVSAGGSNGPTADQGVYFGLRRMPYSTDFTKNNQTFKNIQDNSAVPTGAPFAFWPAAGTDGASGGNSEVHNTGEVWASMLWECYAGILQGTLGASPRMTFTQARDRMKDYLVAGYKATPGQPTLLEGRDAILSAIYASGNTADYQACVGGFAKRGAGVGAVSPDRYSTTNDGVTESFSPGNQLTFVGATIADDVVSCDNDSVLDSGETGTLTISLRNDSALHLAGTTAVVTAVGPNAANVSFPQGNTVNFLASSPIDTFTGTVRIALAPGLIGIQQIDLQITPADPQLTVQTPSNWSRRGNYDDVLGQSATDDVESGSPQFTFVTLGNVATLTPWFRNENSAYDHSYKVADQNGVTDLALQSPSLSVGVGTFTVSFQHRYSFPFAVLYDGPASYAGGAVEISTDNGSTWTDIGSLATGQSYTGALVGGTALGTRRVFGGISPGYPGYVTSTINLGTTYAGTTARIRFRALSVSTLHANGWEVDNIAFSGIANRPFPALLPNKCTFHTTNNRPTVTISTQAAVPERTVVTLTATGADLDFDTLTYSWTQVSGPAVTLVAGTSPNIITFTSPDVPAAGGSVVIGVFAFDGTAYSTLATRSVAVTNVDRPPVVSAGIDQMVDEGTLVQLAGSGSDPDGDVVTFAWTQTAGPAVTLTSTSVANPFFAAPQVGIAGAVLTFKLAATANGVTVNASVNITVRNVPNSRTNQTVTFAPASPANLGVPPITLTASATSGLTAFTFSTSSANTVCTVAGNQLSIVGAGTCTLVAFQPGNADYNSANANANVIINPVFMAAQSRKTHGSAGTFDLTINTALIAPNVTVEPRAIGSGHTIVFQFSGAVATPGTASVTPVGTASTTFLGNEVLVTLMNVPDNRRVTVTLTNVNGSVNPPPVSIGFLVGDVNNTQSVSQNDVSSVKARSGQTTTSANFNFDVNASGAINSSDISTVKTRSALSLVLP